jgi:hypothetical protein
MIEWGWEEDGTKETCGLGVIGDNGKCILSKTPNPSRMYPILFSEGKSHAEAACNCTEP